MPSKVHKRLSIEELKSIVKPIAEKYGIDKIYLFGSVARGDHNKNSDYDLCIESEKIRTLLDLSELLQEFRNAIGYKVDIIEKGALKDEFLKSVINDGVELYAQ